MSLNHQLIGNFWLKNAITILFILELFNIQNPLVLPLSVQWRPKVSGQLITLICLSEFFSKEEAQLLNKLGIYKLPLTTGLFWLDTEGTWCEGGEFEIHVCTSFRPFVQWYFPIIWNSYLLRVMEDNSADDLKTKDIIRDMLLLQWSMIEDTLCGEKQFFKMCYPDIWNPRQYKCIRI